MDYLLHTEYIDRIPLFGWYVRRLLVRRSGQLLRETEGKRDPDVSIVIRTKNDIGYIETLFSDIREQDYDGKVEILLVDTSSTDGTAEFAKTHGAKVITITQDQFTYPKALNMGFNAARHPYVVTLVGHSLITSRLFLKSLTHWSGDNFGGVFNWPLPNGNASLGERLGAAVWVSHSRRPEIVRKPYTGILAANCAIISRQAWKKLGGFDETFAAGGEDSALGISMIEAGMTVAHDPLCTVYHSHGLGPINSLRQVRHWKQIAKPIPFDTAALNHRRPDMRAKSRLTESD